MKTKLLFLFLIIFLLTQVTISQIAYSPRIDSLINLITTATITKLDRELSGDTTTIVNDTLITILSRHYNSPYNQKAAQYIYQKLAGYGLSTRYMNNSTTSVNVIATKTGIRYPNRQFIICGHYDDMPSGTTAPGADDNASGVVAVIEAARLLSALQLDYTVKFIAFDEEERGLYGSKAYVDTAYFKGDTILGVINLDMIAYDGNNDNYLTIHTNANSMSLTNDFVSVINNYQPLLVPFVTTSISGGSDHQSFWTRNYKAILAIEYTSDFNPYYHTVNDKFMYANIQYFTRMVKAAVAGILAMSLDYRINIVHTPLNDGNDTTARVATAVITSPKPLGKTGIRAPRLYYKTATTPFNYVTPYYNNLDTFKFLIPGKPLGTTVSYYIAAQDSAGNMVLTSPSGGKGVNPPGTTAPSTLYSYNIANIVNVTIGTGTTSTGWPFYTYYMDSRTDMLYLGSEISAGGGVPGYITRIGFNVISAASQVMNGFKVKMMNTPENNITEFTSNGWTTVYDGAYSVPGTGWQYVNLTTPFYWSGSNLLIEICFNNSSYTSNSTVNGTSATGRVVHNHQDLSSGDGCVDITTPGSSYTTLPNIRITINLSTGEEKNITTIPNKYSLAQNYPNPFNPVTKINYSIPKSGFVSLKVYDILGRVVHTLVNDVKEAGNYIIDFNASELSSGVYYYKLESGDFSQVRKMTIMK